MRGTDDRTLPVSAVAATALRSVSDDSRLALLAALLDDPASEACAVLRDSGADVDAVRHAAHPVMWARAEADERAREHKRATRTDDLLLAMLVTHEVAAAYPHLAVHPGNRSSRILAALA